MSTSAESNVPRPCWRLLPFDRGSSVGHVALSDALVRHTHIPSLWWHASNRPTVILGSGQPQTDIDFDACRRFGILVVRRHAGGTAVFADDHVLGLDIALPTGHPLAGKDVVEAYRWVGEAWCETLHRFGVEARTLSIDEARRKNADSEGTSGPLQTICFAGFSPYEVVVGDRKIVGLAQVRRRNGTLIQSGIQSHLEVERLIGVLHSADLESVSHDLRSRAVGLDQVLQHPPSWDNLVGTFHCVLKDRYGVMLRPSAWSQEELRHATEAQSHARSE